MTEQNRRKCKDEKYKSVDFERWIEILITLLVVLNVLLFITYQRAHMDENFWFQLWQYVESSAFQGLTAGLAIPLILFFLERHFNFIQSIVEKRKEREKREIEEHKEKKKKIEEDHREKRLQAIVMTSDVLKQINGLVSEVRFYEIGTESNINGILTRIASLSISVSELINIWIFRFPILPRMVHSLFRNYVVTMYWGAWAVAHCIKYEIDENRRELQETLAMIQRGIIGIAFIPLVNTLTYSMNLLELADDIAKDAEGDVQKKIIDIIRFKIEKNFKDSFDTNNGNIYKIINKEIDNSSNTGHHKPLIAIWIECEHMIKKEINPPIFEAIFNEINSIVPQINKEIRDKMKTEINNLILNLFQLEIYERLLKIDNFTNEEILPPSNLEKGISNDIRISYQELKMYMEKPGVLEVGSTEYEEFLKSETYVKFRSLFYKIQDIELMNIIAIDTVKRIRGIGTTIRFGSVIPFDEGDVGAVQ